MAFRAVCEREDVDDTERLQQLGSLMNKSHASLQNLYECSHPWLDKLVAAEAKCGALGARLTGAGWGGCTVALTTSDKAEEFVENLKKEYYCKYHLNDETGKERDLSNFVFQTEPKQGAAVYLLD